jgi:hypothetical protein
MHLSYYIVRSSENGKFFKQTLYRKSRNTFCVQFFFVILFLCTKVKRYVRVREATGKNIIRRMRFVCWIKKSKTKNSEYLTLIAFRQPQPLHEHTSIFSYPYIVSIVVVTIGTLTNTHLPAAHGNSWSSSLLTITHSVGPVSNIWIS